VVDLGEGLGGWPPFPPLLWVQKEEITEGRTASRGSKTTPRPPGISSLALYFPFKYLAV